MVINNYSYFWLSGFLMELENPLIFREIYIFNAGPFASRQRVSEYLTPELKW